LLVLGVYGLIQQVENNFLAPRILGQSVKIHPLVVLVGAIGGYAVGGIVGAFLATPVIGTFRILGQYLYFKLVEVDTPPVLGEGTRPPSKEVARTQRDAEEEEGVDAQS
jgi:predicted PurR-regulated permease PerM